MCFNVSTGVGCEHARERILGQVVTFSRTNCNTAASSETSHKGRRVAKVPSIVNRIAINKWGVINVILFIVVFARCSNRGHVSYCLYMYFR